MPKNKRQEILPWSLSQNERVQDIPKEFVQPLILQTSITPTFHKSRLFSNYVHYFEAIKLKKKFQSDNNKLKSCYSVKKYRTTKFSKGKEDITIQQKETQVFFFGLMQSIRLP